MKTKLILALMLVFTMKSATLYAQTNSTELEEETIDEVWRILRAEFEN